MFERLKHFVGSLRRKSFVYIRGSCLVLSCHVDKLFGGRFCGASKGSFGGFVGGILMTSKLLFNYGEHFTLFIQSGNFSHLKL